MSTTLYGLIPAAGSGTRLGGRMPKQYLSLAGHPMLWHALHAMLSQTEIATVFIVLAPDDAHYASFDWSEFGDRAAPLYCGGASRRDSVLNALIALRNVVEADDWVLVHDAARPCLQQTELTRLIGAVRENAVGGLLAMPLADTLKRADGAQHVAATMPRKDLWLAQTPQMFRQATLVRALDGAPQATDEAAAVEALGLCPLLVEGNPRNLKITYPGDLRIAEIFLAAAQ